MPDDSDEDEEQSAGVESSLLQSLLAQVEALTNAKDRSDNKGASSDTEARTIALIAVSTDWTTPAVLTESSVQSSLQLL